MPGINTAEYRKANTTSSRRKQLKKRRLSLCKAIGASAAARQIEGKPKYLSRTRAGNEVTPTVANAIKTMRTNANVLSLHSYTKTARVNDTTTATPSHDNTVTGGGLTGEDAIKIFSPLKKAIRAFTTDVYDDPSTDIKVVYVAYIEKIIIYIL
ncbi:hypothetical protein [Pyrobaculum ferrireducens]|uniref:hypothetical protein n=1 Tax=Pyrobaculum ferrireducens TaxID=1104324 RepID=UPI0011E526E3|nr:hypothetical protein [Pyrobaculum ferrireducens]